MERRGGSEEFANYVAGLSDEGLSGLTEKYHRIRNQGIKKITAGVVFYGGAMATATLTHGEALKFVALGELAVSGVTGLYGIENFFNGRYVEKTAQQELQLRNESAE